MSFFGASKKGHVIFWHVSFPSKIDPFNFHKPNNELSGKRFDILYFKKTLPQLLYGLNYIAYSFVDQKGILSIRLDRGVLHKKEPKV